jgi:hypothetical protein
MLARTGLDRLLDLVRVGDVEGEGERLAARALGSRRGEVSIEIVAEHARARLRQRRCNHATDIGPGAGHQCDAAFQIVHQSPPEDYFR